MELKPPPPPPFPAFLSERPPGFLSRGLLTSLKPAALLFSALLYLFLSHPLPLSLLLSVYGLSLVSREQIIPWLKRLRPLCWGALWTCNEPPRLARWPALCSLGALSECVCVCEEWDEEERNTGPQWKSWMDMFMGHFLLGLHIKHIHTHYTPYFHDKLIY